MSAPHREAIVQLKAVLCRKFGLSPNTNPIVYHHWYDLNTGERTNGTGSAKTCPVTAFFGGNKVADAAVNFVSLVAAALETAVPAVRTVVAHATFHLQRQFIEGERIPRRIGPSPEAIGPRSARGRLRNPNRVEANPSQAELASARAL